MRELEGWIERRERTLARAAAEVARPAGHGAVPRATTLRLVPQPGRERVHRRGDDLLVPKRDAAAALERWYRRQARTEIGAAARRRHRPRRRALQRAHDPQPEDALGVVLATRPHVVQLAAAARARRTVLDYVVEHEVCHLEVLDHSPRFWALLEARVPDWRDHARWLRRYGATLRL